MKPTEWEIITLGLISKYPHIYPLNTPNGDKMLKEFVQRATSAWKQEEQDNETI